MGVISSASYLSAITPQVNDADAQQLSYPDLQQVIDTYYPKELEHIEELFEGEDICKGDVNDDVQLSHECLLLIAQRLQQAATPKEKQLWSARYTKASVKLFGKPSAKEVSWLAAGELKKFEDVSQLLGGYYGFIEPILEEYQLLAKLKPAQTVTTLEDRFYAALNQTRQHFLKCYQPLLSLFDEYEDHTTLEPAEVKELFSRALGMLQRDDPFWKEWSVVWNDSATLSVSSYEHQIYVGKYRAPIPFEDIRGLFAHEVLVHAQRAVNGTKLHKELACGLPGYLDAEEGLGVLVESAVNGAVPDKVKDRYLDIAMALGHTYRAPMTRPELFAITFARSVVRAVTCGDEHVDLEPLRQAAWAHVNRIYRGTLGNDYVAVFTKDVAYFNGLKKIATHIEKRLKQDMPINKQLSYMLTGKFDPELYSHSDFVFTKQLLREL